MLSCRYRVVNKFDDYAFYNTALLDFEIFVLHAIFIRHEAMVDCVQVLSKLVDSKGKILIPGINENVAEMSEAEKEVGKTGFR